VASQAISEARELAGRPGLEAPGGRLAGLRRLGRRAAAWWTGASADQAWAALHTASLALLAIEPPEVVKARLADLAATVVTALSPGDLRIPGYLRTLELLAPARAEITAGSAGACAGDDAGGVSWPGRMVAGPGCRGSRGLRWREPLTGRRAVLTAPAGSVPEGPGQSARRRGVTASDRTWYITGTVDRTRLVFRGRGRSRAGRRPCERALVHQGSGLAGGPGAGRADPSLIQSGGADGARSGSALRCGSCTLVT
jgi:hypothetical protein